MYQRFYFIAMHWFSRKGNKTKVKTNTNMDNSGGAVQWIYKTGRGRRQANKVFRNCNRRRTYRLPQVGIIHSIKYKYTNTNMQIQIRKYELQVKCIHDIKLYSAKSLTELQKFRTTAKSEIYLS